MNDGIRDSPLHFAARTGSVENVLRLLNEGVPVNKLDYDQMTPLHEACLGGHFDCAKLLINNHAMVNSPNIDGATPLCEASAAGSVECVRLLLEHGATVNPPLALASPLHDAIIFGRGASSTLCVQLLVKSGAKLDASDCHLGTPLHVATETGNMDWVRILLTAGATVNAIKTHRSALHIAAGMDLTEVASLLIEFGANVYLRNNCGKTARDLTIVNSALRRLLHFCEVNPKSLMALCRLRIRQSLGSKRIKSVGDLGLPNSLIAYLEHRQVQAIVDANYLLA